MRKSLTTFPTLSVFLIIWVTVACTSAHAIQDNGHINEIDLLRTPTGDFAAGTDGPDILVQFDELVPSMRVEGAKFPAITNEEITSVSFTMRQGRGRDDLSHRCDFNPPARVRSALVFERAASFSCFFYSKLPPEEQEQEQEQGQSQQDEARGNGFTRSAEAGEDGQGQTFISPVFSAAQPLSLQREDYRQQLERYGRVRMESLYCYRKPKGAEVVIMLELEDPRTGLARPADEAVVQEMSWGVSSTDLREVLTSLANPRTGTLAVRRAEIAVAPESDTICRFNLAGEEEVGDEQAMLPSSSSSAVDSDRTFGVGRPFLNRLSGITSITCQSALAFDYTI